MSIPPIDEAQALKVARTLFGVDGIEAKSLGSCQDANFRITTKATKTIGSALRYVLKVSCSIYSREELQYQNDVINHLNTAVAVAHLTFPKVVRLANGSDSCIGSVDLGGVPHLVRLLTYVEGALLADFKYYSTEASRGIGSFIASMHNALATCSATVANKSQWDMQWAFDNIMVRVGELPSSQYIGTLVGTVKAMQEFLDSRRHRLRSQVVHSDLAPYNVIALPSERGRPQVSGVIDFGDVTTSWLAGDIVSALVPLLEGEGRDAIALAADVVAGYCASRALLREEVECLWPLVVLRASLLYITVSHLLLSDPDNTYTKDEVVLDKRILDRVLRVPHYAATRALLAAAGIEPYTSPVAVAVSMAPERIFAGKSARPLDLSVLSQLYDNGNWLHTSSFEKLLREHVQHELAGGGRVLYIPSGIPVFYAGAQRRRLEESPSVPLGVTAFMPPGARVCLDLSHVLGAGRAINHSSRPLLSARDNPFLRELISPVCTSHFFDTGEHIVLIEGVVDVLRVAEGVVELSAKATGRPFETLHLQVLPAGLDAAGSSNDARRYGLCYAPPAYCCAATASLWRSLCPPPLTGGAPPSEGEELSARYAYFASVQQHYFRQPPVIERGYLQFLYDTHGRAYLDMVNNVALVGHCHPKVAEAAARQMRLLNTNSRFVYSVLGKFCSKIISKVPQAIRERGRLNRVFLVNSGSEATDLAMRIARTVVTERRRKAQSAIGGTLAGIGNALLLGLPGLLADSIGMAGADSFSRDVICLAGGYHGVTTASDEVSTTLNDNPRSLETRPPWIHLVPMPNLFRGLHRLPHGAPEAEAVDAGRRYAQLVEAKVAGMMAAGRAPAAFICETLSGNAGGVELPPGYLKLAYNAVRSAGGLCIADEVQVGYGRLGRNFWGFEEHGVEPDIVTMAKAAGNGHPLGFVITSQEIADEFGADGSFFSSAGGGPVSCAVGLAVLEALEEEALQSNALEVGTYLHKQLLALQSRHPENIGTVHGHGLYQGVELVRGGGGKGAPGAAATEEAYAVCERLLELGVICHNTGDYSNVLKVKPPLCFSKEDADFFVQALDLALTGW